MYESNHFYITIEKYRSEGMEVSGLPTVQGAKRRREGTKGWSVCWEAVEGLYLDISGATCVKAKENYEISGFG